MSGSGLNGNMNHAIKRIETRVLAPPGGFSSISFGSSSGPSYADHSTYTKNRSIQSMKEDSRRSEPAAARRNPPRAYEKENGRDREYGRGRIERRDSLDELVEQKRAIPGLEGHYQGHQQQASNRSRSRPVSNESDTGFGRQDSGSSARVDKHSYAEMLRQQIALKNSMSEDERDGRRGSRYPTEKTEAYHSRVESSAPVAVINSRRRTGNHVGNSQISFS
jgi:hypothetical protein